MRDYFIFILDSQIFSTEIIKHPTEKYFLK